MRIASWWGCAAWHSACGALRWGLASDESRGVSVGVQPHIHDLGAQHRHQRGHQVVFTHELGGHRLWLWRTEADTTRRRAVNGMKGIHPNRGTCTYLRIVRGLHLQSRLAVGQLHHQTESTLLAGIHVGASGAGGVVVAVGITSVGGSCERHGPGLALACCVGHTHTRLVAAVYRAVLRWKGSTHSNSRQTMSPPGPAAVQFRTGDEAACDVGI